MEEHTINELLAKLDADDDNSQAVEHQVQALLVQELNSMSTDERNGVFQDVHGVSDVVEETEDFVMTKLDLLEYELSNMHTGNEAYLMAKQQSLDYVSDENFRLKFLRGFRFDEKAAATGIIQFFEQKQILFGNEKLVKDICLSDMSDEDIACIKSGYCMLLSCRDRIGRPILFFNGPQRGGHPRESVLRTIYYFFMAVADDESNQQKGAVMVGFNIGGHRMFDPTLASRGGRIVQSLPIHIAAFHICCDSSFLRLLSPLVMIVMGKSIRQRFRAHYGTYKECILEIQSYGIPHVILPIDMDGNNDDSRIIEWYEMRKRIEKAKERQANRITTSSPTDSLLEEMGTDMGCGGGGCGCGESSCDDTTLPGDEEYSVRNQDMPSEVGWDDNNDFVNTEHKEVDDNKVIVAIPGYYDVLFGRGKSIITHPGNLRFHQLLDLYQTRYESSRKKEKGIVVSQILKAVWDSSGRFLKQNGKKGGWVEVSAQEAHGKVSQGYRTRRSSLLAGVDLGSQREAAMAVLDMNHAPAPESVTNAPPKRVKR